jgi:branched-subunit amino acid aminotransferase/4-amino-4-deoxychorismate lyase
VIEAAGPELTVKEGKFSLSQFLGCDEVFIASSVREIIPIRQWDDKVFTGVPGNVTKLVHEKLQAHIKSYLRTHSGY